MSDGKTRGRYNYDQIDIVLDFLVSNHIIPFLDFGNRPSTAVFAPDTPVYFEGDYIPFVSKEMWQGLLRDFMLHIMNRYGDTEASRWIFEFSCDNVRPDCRFYQDENYQYYDVFHFAERTIHFIFPGAQVGGPMAMPEADYDATAGFLRQCHEGGHMPDFVSFQLFPYRSIIRDGAIFLERTAQKDMELHQVALMRSLLQENHAEGCRLYISEWNNTLSNRCYLNDSCYRAAYFAKNISRIGGMVDLIGIWIASDWVSSYFDTVNIANGGSGLLTKDSVRKPALFALRFLNRMGSEILDTGEHHLLTRAGDGTLFLLAFNYKHFSASYYLRDENMQDPSGLQGVFEDERPLDLTVTLDGMQAQSEYIVKRRSINHNSGSVLAEWENFGFDTDLLGSDIKHIRESCHPGMHMERRHPENGKLILQLHLLFNEVTLLHIYESLR